VSIARKSLFARAKALERLPVLGALEGTPAARAGVRYGDVLLSVNGMRTRTVSDYVEAKNLRSDGMAIVVFRSGEERLADLAYDGPARPLDPAALLAELVTLRVAPGPEDDLDEGLAGGNQSS
jgi:predicted metalloprotease with PDZ domain